MAEYSTNKSPWPSLLDKPTFDQVTGYKVLPIQLFEIKLHRNSIYKPGDDIKGNVILNNNEDLGCLGIVVCLEGYASVSYQSGSVVRRRVEKLLSHNTNEWTTVFLLGCLEDYHQFSYRRPKHHKILAGENVFPFKISTVKLNPFTGTFKGTSGEVNYRLIACVIIKAARKQQKFYGMRDFNFVEQSIEFHSYLNLETYPLAAKAVTTESWNSFITKKKIKSTVYLSRTGFLPGETIPFTLTVLNPRGKNISKFSVALICKTTYTSDVSSRINSTVLGITENNDVSFDLEGRTEWTDLILIPVDLYPSVSGHLIEHQYSVKIDIYAAGKDSPTLKSVVPITIGSVREDESLSIENRRLPRSMSLMSLKSSTGSFESLPPAYSDIFSSTMSMETLPPLYEDAVQGYSDAEALK